MDEERSKPKTDDDIPLFSLAGVSRFVEPELDKPDRAAAHEYDTAQSAYLTASGTLTQFNAIVAAIQAAAFSATTGPLRVAVAIALVLHVLSAYLLCWAARPIEPHRASDSRMTLIQARLHVHDTFKNYRRGWRITMLALCMSCAALIFYVLNELGFLMPRISN